MMLTQRLFNLGIAVCIILLRVNFSTAADTVTQIASGPGKITAQLGGKPIEVFTYKPSNYRGGPLIVVCHGMSRTAEAYRDAAQRLADRMDAIVVAPLFDKERFPTAAYQHGGLFEAGKLQPAELWTVSFIPQLVAEVRRREGNANLSYYLIGHSAGGQLLERLAGFTQSGAVRIVAANPGTHLFPTRDVPFPHGFGGLPDNLSNDAALRRYLAQPLSIYLGTADNGDKNLSMDPDAVKQGATRYERGQNCYQFAAELAKKNNWQFNWRLVEAPEIAHDTRGMFQHEKALEALQSSKN